MIIKNKLWIFLFIGLLLLGLVGFWTFKRFSLDPNYFTWNFKKTCSTTTYIVGQPVDSLNGTFVFYNGSVGHVSGRNTTADGYNLGLKYQCVEFVKRYYYEQLNHKMPDSYGHAKDFFDHNLADGQLSRKRNLIQFSNPSQTKPKVDDLLIFEGTTVNKYGHVAIVSKVNDKKIEIIQQNPGPNSKSRETFLLDNKNGKWKIKNNRILGWLRKR